MKPNDLTVRAIVAFLFGFSRSDYSDKALVRGSFITREYMHSFARQCKDLDLLYLNNYSLIDIEKLLRQAIEHVAPEDGVLFKLETLSTEEIWKLSLSPGVRATVSFVCDGYLSELQIDIAANDPLVEKPIPFAISLPSGESTTVKTVGLETSVAWKFHGLFEHLNGSWMSKTLWDLYVLCRFNTLNKKTLKLAIHTAFDSRLDPLEITKRFFFGDFAQSKKSRKSWPNDLISLTTSNDHSLFEILAWLKEYLLEVVDVKNDGLLLTHSEVITYRVKELRRLGTDDAFAKLKTLNRKTKILSTKVYDSIPHLPGSRIGLSEKTVDRNKTRMLTSQAINDSDLVIVQEKLDGSCVCVYRRGDQILALGKDGDLASESANHSIQIWSDWVDNNEERFMKILNDGERVCGEWLALAHGTRYKLTHEPFVVFDFFDSNNKPYSFKEINDRCKLASLTTPFLVHEGGPCSIEMGLEKLKSNFHCAIDQTEGLVYRLERQGRVLFRAKFVRNDKVGGCYLPEKTNDKELWNWHPVLGPTI